MVSKNSKKKFSGKEMTKNNRHAGHRQRLKDNFLKTGLDGFSSYQVLEMLLYYALPQQDTNDLAHDLIDHFGSLPAVLDAEYERLLEVPGVGPHTASLITMMVPLFSRYGKESVNTSASLNGPEDYGKYLINFFIGKKNEEFYMVCLDNDYRVTHTALINTGSINEVFVHPRITTEQALLHHARYVLLAHNHPGGSVSPSSYDVRLTDTIQDVLSPLSITVLDHIIVSGQKYFSFAAKGLICKKGAGIRGAI